MCFSATGSFAVSGLLAGIGATSLVRTEERSLRLFAAVPLLFAAQQAAEGIVWLTLDGQPRGAAGALAIRAFLGFALVVWPLWLPWSLWLAEKDPRRRRPLAAMAWLGAVVAAVSSILLGRWQPTAHIAGHSIAYDIDIGISGDNPFPLVVYLVPTIAPFFVSTISLGRVMGYVLVISLAVTVAVRWQALTSVWCFFAALMSGLIMAIVAREQRARVAAPREA